MLARWDEELEAPLLTAAATSDGRYLRDALEHRRTETLRAVLVGVEVQAARGGPRVRATALTPHLQDPDVEVRRSALCGLSRDPSYVAGEDVFGLVIYDPDVTVRAEATRLVIDRGGEPAALRVVEHLRQASDPDLEGHLAGLLAGFPAGRALAEDRLVAPGTPVRLALLYLSGLWRVEGTPPPSVWLERALAGDDAEVQALAAGLSMQAGLDVYRAIFQDRWRGAGKPAARRGLGRVLVAWDLRTGGEQRLGLALEICEESPGTDYRAEIEELTRCGVGWVAERSRALLRDRRSGEPGR